MGNNQATPMHHSLPGKAPSKFKKMLQSVTKDSNAPPKATSIVLYPILAEHPLLQQKNDPFLLKFIEPLESALKLNPDFTPLKSAPSNFQAFIQKLKDDNQDAIKKVAPRSVFDRVVCEKSIEPQGLCFMCFDCSIKDQRESALMCCTCFEKSNHKNHLVRAMINTKTSPEKCSCGNSDLLKPEGFCYEQWEGPKQNPEALANVLRLSRLEDYEIMLKKAFYGVFSIFEMRIRTKNPRLKSELQTVGQVYLSRLLDFCQKSYNGLNDPLLLITAKALMSPLPPKCDNLWHRCESMTPQDFEEKIMVEKAHLCKCTILAGILKLMVFMNEGDEWKLCSILKDCRRVSGFGDCLTKEMLRNHAFLYTLDQEVDFPLIRYEMYRFVKGQEEAFDSGHFDGLMQLLREIVGSERFPKDEQLRTKVWHILWTVIPAFLKPCYSTSQKIIRQPSFRKNILEMLKEVQRKSPSRIEIGKVSPESLEEAVNGLRWSREFYHLVVLCSKLLSRLPKEEKIALSKTLITEWAANYEEINSGEEVSLNLGMERAFCGFLSNYLRGNISQKEIQNFFQETETSLEIAKAILKRILKAIGTLKYLQRMHSVDMPIKSLMSTYYDLSSVHFDIDIIGIQLLALTVVEPRELYVLLVENYFYYDLEIQGALLSATTENLSENKINLVGDFARLIRYILTNEICQLNFDLKCAKELLGEEINFGSRYLRVTERVIVNVLLSKKKFSDAFELKEKIAKIVIEDPKIEKAISKVIEFKENSREVGLRKEYQEDVVLEIDDFGEKCRDQENEDFIGQKLNLKDISAHLKTLQRILFESSSRLIECLKKIEMEEGLMKATLQLMLLELEGMEEGELKNEKNKEFEEFISKNKHSKYSRFYQSQSKLEDQEEKKCEKEEEKEAAKTTSATHSQNEEYKLNEEPTSRCEQCRQKIEKNEAYGMPIYMVLSNNLYDEENASIYDLEKETGLINAVWWPVISSCGHHYHQKCFEKTSYRRIDSGNIYGKYESSCPTCKEACNAFLPLHQEEEVLHRGGKSSIDTVSLPKRLQVMIMQILRETIVTWFYYEDLYIISIGEVFQKSYQYFIETFHIYNSPSELHQKLKIYSPFFKTFKSYFSSSDKLKLTKQTFIVEAYEQHLQILPFDPSSQNNNKGSEPENIFLRFNHLPEDVLNVYLASLFIDSINQPAEVVMMKQVQLFKEYLSYRLVQILNRGRVDQDVDLEDCLNFYFENPDLQELIISQLLYPIKKIMLAFALNQTNVSSENNSEEICEILYESDEEGLEYINKLLGAVGIDKSFDELIFETLASLPQSSDCDGPILRYMLTRDASVKRLDQVVVKKLSPQVVTLPPSYAEFNFKYAQKKCSYCEKYSSDLSLCLCLICGQTLCANKCAMADPKEMHLNFHAKKFHRGNCAYISVHSPELILVSDKDMKKTEDLVYIDGLKQTVQEIFAKHPDTACLDLKKFNLEEKTAKKMKDMIICNSFRTNMFE